MFLNLSDICSLLILAPHPDDEALGCAGSIMLLNRNGASSTIVYLTNGEKLYGETSEYIAGKRKEEAKTASEMLGCKETLFLNFPDGEVGSYAEEIHKKLCEIIEKKKPDIVFSPSPVDYHHDHIAASTIALRLLDGLHHFKVAFYEVYSTLRFSHLVDITEVAERKRQIISAYKTSLYEKPDVYIHASLGLNAQRSIFVQKTGYYEAFWVTEKPLSKKEIIDWLTYGIHL